MKNVEGKKYEHNGKSIKIVPLKKVKKAESKSTAGEEESAENGTEPVKKPKKKASEKTAVKFAVNDKVSLKNIPAEYSGFGFGESIVIKVFKSTHDNAYRYSIRSSSGQEMAMLKSDQLKVRK